MKDFIVKKLRDPVEDVRLRAVQTLLNFAENNLLHLSMFALEELGERGKDKKFEIRREALLGLAKLYCRNISSQLLPLSNENLGTIASINPENILNRLNFVPTLVVKCWGYPEPSSKHLIIQLLQEQILPKKISDENNLSAVRAAALVLCFTSIDLNDRIFLKSILAFKSRVRGEVLRIKDLKIAQLEKKEDNKSIIEDMKFSLYNLIQLVILPDKKLAIFDKFISSR